MRNYSPARAVDGGWYSSRAGGRPRPCGKAIMEVVSHKGKGSSFIMAEIGHCETQKAKASKEITIHKEQKTSNTDTKATSNGSTQRHETLDQTMQKKQGNIIKKETEDDNDTQSLRMRQGSASDNERSKQTNKIDAHNKGQRRNKM